MTSIYENMSHLTLAGTFFRFEALLLQEVCDIYYNTFKQNLDFFLFTVDHDEIWILYVKIITEPPGTIKS